MTDQEYLLGTSDDEVTRLEFQHRVWARYAFDHWNRAGFGPRQTLVDLGCGVGSATLVRHIAHQCRCRRVDHIRPVQADVRRIPLDRESVDGIYARWLMCFIREPEVVVEQIAGILRPGGAVALKDYFNYKAFTLAPRCEILDRVVSGVYERWQAGGGDLDIMLKMPAMLQAAGLVVEDVRPIVRVAAPRSALWQWPTTFFRNYLPILVKGGFVDARCAEDFLAEWSARTESDIAYLFTPPMMEVVARKA